MEKKLRFVGTTNITILEQLYTLTATSNKRKLIYNDEDKLIGTRPFFLIDGKLNTDLI
jgi:hypothetical protein